MNIKYQLFVGMLIMGSLYAMELEDFGSKNKEKEPTDSLRALKKQASTLRVSAVEDQLDKISEHEDNAFKRGSVIRDSPLYLTTSKNKLEEIIEASRNTDHTIVDNMLDLIREEAEKSPVIKKDFAAQFNEDPILGNKLREQVNRLRDSENPEERGAFNSLNAYSTEREMRKTRRRKDHGRNSIFEDKQTDNETKALILSLLVQTLKDHAEEQKSRAEEQKLLAKTLHDEKEQQQKDNKANIKRKNWQIGITIGVGALTTVLAAVITAISTLVPELIKKCPPTA